MNQSIRFNYLQESKNAITQVLAFEISKSTEEDLLKILTRINTDIDKLINDNL